MWIFFPLSDSPSDGDSSRKNPVESYFVVQKTNGLALPTSGPVSQVHKFNYVLAVVSCKTYIKEDKSKILLGPIS